MRSQAWKIVGLCAGLLTLAGLLMWWVIVQQEKDAAEQAAPAPSISVDTPVDPDDPGSADPDAPGAPSGETDASGDTDAQDPSTLDGTREGEPGEELESIWIYEDDDDHSHVHEDVDTSDQWLPIVRDFSAALVATDQPFKTWHQGLRPYVDDALYDAYGYESAMLAFEPREPREPFIVETSEFQQVVDVRYGGYDQDIRVTVRPSDDGDTWVITRVDSI